MADLGQAYVQIVPSADGISGAIEKVLNPEADSAGKSAGTSIGGGIADFAKKAVVALGVGKTVSDSISNGMNFEQMSAKANTLFSGTSTEFQQLQKTIMGISSSTGVAASELMNAAYSAESASVPMGNLGGMIESSSKLATAGFTDIDTALSATAKTMNAYGMMSDDVTETQAAMDQVQKVLIQTQNKGITTVGELGASLAQVTPTAASAGVSFEQVGAGLALMTAKGTPTAQATTQLRSAIAELEKSGTKASMALEQAAEGTEYAGMSFTEMMASGADLGDVMGMLQKHADDSGVSMLDLWSSIEGGNAAMAIASDVDTFKDDLGAMSDSADVVGEAFTTMSETASFKLQKLKNTLSNMGIQAFTATAGVFTKALEGIQKVVDLVSPAFTRLGGALSTLFSKFGGYLADLLGLDGEFSAAETIAGLLNTAINTLSSVFEFLGEHINIVAPIVIGLVGAFTAMQVISTVIGLVTGVAGALGLILSPAGLVVVAITAVIAIGVALYKNWDKVKAAAKVVADTVKKAWDGLKKALQKTVEAIKTKITTVWNGIKTSVTTIVTAIKTKITTVWTAIKTAVSNTVTAIKTKVSTVWTAIKTSITTVVTAIKTKITTVWTAIKTAISNTMTAIKTKITTVWTAAKTSVTTIITAIKTKISTVWTAIKTSVSTAVTAIKTKISTVFTGIKTSISNVMTGIKTKISTVWTNVKTSVSNTVTGIKTKVSTVFTNLKTSVSSTITGLKTSISEKFTSIKTGITDKINGARDAVKSAIEKIKGFFNFHWSLPHLKMPHPSISGSFSLNPPSVPHFSISWYKKGGIINGASVVGVGEAGPEAIIPLSGPSMQPFAAAIADELMGHGSTDAEVVELLRQYLPMLANMKVVLDKGRLVGELAPEMDARMGRIAARQARGN